MSADTSRAERHAWYIGQLVLYLEDRLHFLTPEQYDKLQEKIDRVPAEELAALDPEEFPPIAHVSLEEFLSLATDRDWELAHAMVEERARGLPA